VLVLLSKLGLHLAHPFNQWLREVNLCSERHGADIQADRAINACTLGAATTAGDPDGDVVSSKNDFRTAGHRSGDSGDCGGSGGGGNGSGGGGGSGVPPALVAYTDADYGGCVDSRRSTSGLIVLLAGSPVAWRSKRQDGVATSTCEAEFVACFNGVQKLRDARLLLRDFGFELRAPSPVFMDNENAIQVAANPYSNKRIRHVAVRSALVRELIDAGQVRLCYVPGREQVADIFTKALPAPRTAELRQRILGA
jgi:hypothetical protein